MDLAAVEAAAKKHEAIETDIFAYEERVEAVVTVAQELETEDYHDIVRINARYIFIRIVFLEIGHLHLICYHFCLLEKTMFFVYGIIY